MTTNYNPRHAHDSLAASLASEDDARAPRARSAAIFSRPAALIGGSIGLVALSIAATALVVRAPASKEVADSHRATAMGLVDNGGIKQAPDDRPEAATPKPAPVEAPAPARAATPKPGAERAAPARTATAPAVCSACGVVTAVTPVKQKGQGTGVGAVGGAVVGGLLGNQVGGGNGKKAMTVIGAVGGGVAGHEIEKNARATTVYQVKVRMDDGSTRTVTQSTAPAVGAKVTLAGSQLKLRSS